MNHEIACTRQAYKNTLSNRALLHQFLKLGKFVWREFFAQHDTTDCWLYFIFIKNLLPQRLLARNDDDDDDDDDVNEVYIYAADII